MSITHEEIMELAKDNGVSITADGRVYAYSLRNGLDMTVFDGEDPKGQADPRRFSEWLQDRLLGRAGTGSSQPPQTIECIEATGEIRAPRSFHLTDICNQVNRNKHYGVIYENMPMVMRTSLRPRDVIPEPPTNRRFVHLDLCRDKIAVYVNSGSVDMTLGNNNKRVAFAGFSHAIETMVANALSHIVTGADSSTSAPKISASSSGGFSEFASSMLAVIGEFNDRNGTAITDATANPKTWSLLVRDNPQRSCLEDGNCSVLFDREVMANSSAYVPEGAIYFTAHEFAIIWAHGGQTVHTWHDLRTGQARTKINHFNRVFCTSEELGWSGSNGRKYGFKVLVTK